MDPIESSLRKRGWSIHSDPGGSERLNKSSDEEPLSCPDGKDSKRRIFSKIKRIRSDTEDTLEKMRLLESFPSEQDSGSSSDDLFRQDETSKDENSIDDDEPPNKRRRIELDSNSMQPDDAMTAAKAKLSKWAQRLLDSNRPRGLVETPQIIPLNDEFLIAFGKRQYKKDDRNHIPDVVDDDDDQSSDHSHSFTSSSSSSLTEQIENSQPVSNGGTVDIVNIAYTTTAATIFSICERYGPVVRVSLPLADSSINNSITSTRIANSGVPQPSTSTSTITLNTGRATVVFEYPDDAAKFVACMHQKTLDGRTIYAYMTHGTYGTFAATSSSSNNIINNSNMDKSFHTTTATGRYFVKDISTRCFRCGQVGHISVSCSNPEKSKPCPLCATLLSVETDTTGHAQNLKCCPLYKVCFNCGSPGHVNKACPFRKGVPKRLVCTACFTNGHHRWSCPNPVQSMNPCAKCFTCGQYGHFSCRRSNFFFGVSGISCFNCGQEGHHGSDCDRPNVDACIKDTDVATKEIHRAESQSMFEESYRVKNSQKNHRSSF